MRLLYFLILAAPALMAQTHVMQQTSVPAGTHAEIVLSISSPRSLFIDVLVSNPDVKVVVALPDGKEIKEGEAEPGQPALTAVSDDLLAEAKELLKSHLVSGSGRHLFFVFPSNPPAGNYRVLFENPSALNSARVVARSTLHPPSGSSFNEKMLDVHGRNPSAPLHVAAPGGSMYESRVLGTKLPRILSFDGWKRFSDNRHSHAHPFVGRGIPLRAE